MLVAAPKPYRATAGQPAIAASIPEPGSSKQVEKDAEWIFSMTEQTCRKPTGDVISWICKDRDLPQLVQSVNRAVAKASAKVDNNFDAQNHGATVQNAVAEVEECLDLGIGKKDCLRRAYTAFYSDVLPGGPPIGGPRTVAAPRAIAVLVAEAAPSAAAPPRLPLQAAPRVRACKEQVQKRFSTTGSISNMGADVMRQAAMISACEQNDGAAEPVPATQSYAQRLTHANLQIIDNMDAKGGGCRQWAGLARHHLGYAEESGDDRMFLEILGRANAEGC